MVAMLFFPRSLGFASLVMFAGNIWTQIIFPGSADPIEFPVGVLGISYYGSPFDLGLVSPSIQVAIDKVNRVYLNSSYKLVSIQKTYGKHCFVGEAPGIAADMFYREDIMAFLGPACSYALEHIGSLAAYWNVPIMTGLGDGGQFKNKTIYKTLTRLAYCQCRLRKVFGSVFEYFHWKDISIIYDTGNVHTDVLGSTLKFGLENGNYTPFIVSYNGNMQRRYGQYLKLASDRSRVILLIVPGDSKRELLLEAYNMGYINGQYVFMDVELFNYPSFFGDHHWRRNDEWDHIAELAYEALLRVSLHISNGPEWIQFEKEINQLEQNQSDVNVDRKAILSIRRIALSDSTMENYVDAKTSVLCYEANFFMGAFYDSVILYGMALNETLTAGEDPRDGYAVSRRMWNRTFQGITGKVIVDDNGDRLTSFSIMDMNPATGQFQVVANYLGDKPYYDPVPNVEVHWPGNYGRPPPNEPRCGFRGEKAICIKAENLPSYVIALLVLCFIGLLGMIIGLFVNRHIQEKRNMKAMAWRIDISDIKFNGNKKRSNIDFNTSLVSCQSSKFSMISDCQVFIETATYKGVIVAVKKISRPNVMLTKDLIRELNEVRCVYHPNLTRFIGAAIEADGVFILNEYCNKGSLQDVFANDSVTIDEDLRTSFIKDLVQGMIFLHNSDIKSHGRLTSANCVLDGRFILKVTDFGLQQICADIIYSPKYAEDYKKLLWRAPEHLRVVMPPRGTQKGDVYSFGIILEEILFRCSPYEITSSQYSVKEIIHKVRAGETPPFRPEMYHKDEFICSLAKKCWAENPEDRPDFHSILKSIKARNKGKDKNIMETLLDRMEMYAAKLESLVEERTEQLEIEKKKLETLLDQILPRSIADQLKQGKPVEPEYFDSVTVFFSDIVGYTNLCDRSTPLQQQPTCLNTAEGQADRNVAQITLNMRTILRSIQITTLLNDLYSTFDHVIDSFDVYKVETIGDAYMVASGLPIRNGNRHASEIARMSLRLCETVGNFKVRHCPGEVLQLRIGIHSGSCVAGVVGMKMPRYCLVGDTINTASRMESSGEALKIHTTESTKRLLDEIGGFSVVLRGEVPVKGKGIMKTYWVLGKK